MARVALGASQRKSASASPAKPTPPEEPYVPNRCMSCGHSYPKQAGNFSAVHSKFLIYNNHYLPWCHRCVEQLYNEYMDLGLPEADVIHLLCARFDVYWSQEIYDQLPDSSVAATSRMRLYITKANNRRFVGLCYKNSALEELRRQELRAPTLTVGEPPPPPVEAPPAESEPPIDSELDDLMSVMRESDQREVTAEHIRFWGRGHDRMAYLDLQDRYDELAKEYTVDTPAAKMLLKQACLSEYEIDCLRREGKPFEKQQTSLVNTLGSLNLKPSQIKEAEKMSGLDDMTLGVGAKHWEMTRPIPQADPEWADVDHIAEYVLTWFAGATSDMFEVETPNTEMYRQAIDRYKVSHPGTEEYDDSEVISHILSGGDAGG